METFTIVVNKSGRTKNMWTATVSKLGESTVNPGHPDSLDDKLRTETLAVAVGASRRQTVLDAVYEGFND